jgi:Flp pilus assembly protein TadB
VTRAPERTTERTEPTELPAGGSVSSVSSVVDRRRDERLWWRERRAIWIPLAVLLLAMVVYLGIFAWLLTVVVLATAAVVLGLMVLVQRARRAR